MKKCLVLGAGGFIGSHLVKRLRAEGNHVVGVDLKYPEFSPIPEGVSFFGEDLRFHGLAYYKLQQYDEIYQLAANMGGAGYIFTGENDSAILHNSSLINLNLIDAARESLSHARIFYSSSACVYKEDPNDSRTPEHTAYPALPDSEYGWEKLFSERLYQAAARNYGLTTRIARFHNIFGPEGTYKGGREKAPAAICRKVATAKDGGTIELWGDGTQKRSFLYIDECVEGILRVTRSDVAEPLNIGSEEQITIKELAEKVIALSGKNLTIAYKPGPTGVHGRNSHNEKIRNLLGWQPGERLDDGLKITYDWINEKVNGK